MNPNNSNKANVSPNSAKAVAGSAFALLLALAGDARAQSPGYEITDLGTLGGTFTQPFGLNDLGQVVGESNIAGDSVKHAFLYSAGTMTDLGGLSPSSWSAATGINNSGEIAGASSLGSSTVPYHAVIFSGNPPTDLGTLGGQNSLPNGINSAGQIVGGSDASGQTHAFSYSGGTITDLGGGSAYAVNSSGIVVGYGPGVIASIFTGPNKGPIGTLGGTQSIANGINDGGLIIGYSYIPNTAQYGTAFIYKNGVMSSLGMLAGDDGSVALGINNQNAVVGFSVNGLVTHAVVVRPNGVMESLIDDIPSGSGWSTLESAVAINNVGQITGYGLVNGEQHGFLLTPIPEPSAVVASGCLVVLAAVRKFRPFRKLGKHAASAIMRSTLSNQ